MVNTSAPRRSRLARSTMRSAAAVPVTLKVGSDVAAERGEVEVAAAVGRRVLPHVLDLAVLVVAVVAELAPDARLLVATERLTRRDHVVVVDPHGAGAHLGGTGGRAVEALAQRPPAEAA